MLTRSYFPFFFFFHPFPGLTYDLAQNLIISIWAENAFSFSSSYTKMVGKFASVDIEFASIGTFVGLCWATIWSVQSLFNSKEKGANTYGPRAYVSAYITYHHDEAKRKFLALDAMQPAEQPPPEESLLFKKMTDFLADAKEKAEKWLREHKEMPRPWRDEDGHEYVGDGVPLSCASCGTFQTSKCFVQDGIALAPESRPAFKIPDMSLPLVASEREKKKGWRYAQRLLVSHKDTHDALMQLTDLPHCNEWRVNNPWKKEVRAHCSARACYIITLPSLDHMRTSDDSM
jgi:hypothetical protein